MGGSVPPPKSSAKSSTPAGQARTSAESTSFSMRDLENEIVDISSSSSGLSAITSPSSSKVKLLFAKSKGSQDPHFRQVLMMKSMCILLPVQKITSPAGSLS